MAEVEWLSEREEAAWRALQLMHLRLDFELARRLAAESGLSYPDYTVLVALTAQPDGRLRASALARTLGWEKSRLSHHITRMAARGLVDRAPCPTDRRGAFVVVTPLGRKEIAAAAPGHVQAVRDLFVDHLTARQIDAVGEAAAVVLAALEALPDGEPDQAV